MFYDYEGHGFATDYAMSVESAKFYRVYYTFTASLERLKREALKAFQCASTVKAAMKNTGILAKTLATILVFVRRCFALTRSA